MVTDIFRQQEQCWMKTIHQLVRKWWRWKEDFFIWSFRILCLMTFYLSCHYYLLEPWRFFKSFFSTCSQIHLKPTGIGLLCATWMRFKTNNAWGSSSRLTFINTGRCECVSHPEPSQLRRRGTLRGLCVCFTVCSLTVTYLREPHEFADVLGQEYHVAVGRYHGDEALQRLQVQTVHLSVLIAVTVAAAACRDGQKTRWVTQTAPLIPCWL